MAIFQNHSIKAAVPTLPFILTAPSDSSAYCLFQFTSELSAAWKYTVDQSMGAFAEERTGLCKSSPLIMLADRGPSNTASSEASALPHCLWADVSTYTNVACV